MARLEGRGTTRSRHPLTAHERSVSDLLRTLGIIHHGRHSIGRALSGERSKMRGISAWRV